MKKNLYDDHYKDEDYFGKPYKGLIEFFKNHEGRGKVLDIGCGQGRDSLPLAEMGYQVMAWDRSQVGLDQLQKKAQKKNLKIETSLVDIYETSLPSDTDIVLMDSMLHFYKNDLEKERDLVKKILFELKRQGIFVNFMVKGKNREKVLKDILKEVSNDFEIMIEKYVAYPEANAHYHMLVIRKK